MFVELASIASGPPLEDAEEDPPLEDAEEDERTAEEDAGAAAKEDARTSRVRVKYCIYVRALSYSTGLLTLDQEYFDTRRHSLCFSCSPTCSKGVAPTALYFQVSPLLSLSLSLYQKIFVFFGRLIFLPNFRTSRRTQAKKC